MDERLDNYTMSAYLIAQLGKNFSESGGTEITGAELLKLAWDKIKEIQYLGGGIVTFLEAENEEKLLFFYRNNCFSQFDTRQTTSDTDKLHELIFVKCPKSCWRVADLYYKKQLHPAGKSDMIHTKHISFDSGHCPSDYLSFQKIYAFTSILTHVKKAGDFRRRRGPGEDILSVETLKAR